MVGARELKAVRLEGGTEIVSSKETESEAGEGTELPGSDTAPQRKRKLLRALAGGE